MSTQIPWWKKAVFYQIYPRSYSDSTNNGIGDLSGIIQKINGGYLPNLGINAIWLSPIFPSPQEDFGYDITDYTSINSDYGTMEDFDELLETAHSNDLKIILDIVLNHTSHEHPWFVQSKSSQTSPKRDWYIWKKGRGASGKKPPNNWKTLIGGSAWEWDERTKEYYLHQFLPCQPDLNWRNPEVKEQMFDSMKFWLKKGIDGFRLDIIHTVFKDAQFRNNPWSYHILPSHSHRDYLLQNPQYTQFQKETRDLCIELRSLVDEFSPERVLVGEATGGPKIFSSLYGRLDRPGLNLVFDFQFTNQPFSAQKFQDSILESKTHLSNFWPCFTFSNHDIVRMISRYGNNKQKAKLLALMLLTLQGTPFIYQGEEIGMLQGRIAKDQIKDPISKLKIWGLPVGRFFGRDGCRTPMQWNNSPLNAGFCPDPMTKPWLPISVNVQDINIASQNQDEESMLSFYRELLHLRQKADWLQEGDLEILNLHSKHCLAFSRVIDSDRGVIILNFYKNSINVINPLLESLKIFSTHTLSQSKKMGNIIALKRFEGIIIQSTGVKD